MVTQALQAQTILAEPPNNLKLNSPPPHPGWEIRPPSMFNNDPMQVRQSVYNFDAWAAIIVNPNATAMLRQAVATGNTTYDPLGAGQIIYVEARDETTVDTYILPVLYQFQLNIASMFGETWGKMVFQNASTDPTILTNIQNAPQTVSPAIGWSVFNLRPFSPPVATPAVTIGLICVSTVPCYNSRHNVIPLTSDRFDYSIFLFLRLLSSDSLEIHQATRTSASCLLAGDNLALVCHGHCLLVSFPLLLPYLARLPDTLQQPACASHRSRRQR